MSKHSCRFLEDMIFYVKYIKRENYRMKIIFNPTNLFVYAVLMLVSFCAACPNEDSDLPDVFPEIVITEVTPNPIVMPTTWIKIKGEGFVDNSLGQISIILRREGVSNTVFPDRESDELIKFQLGTYLFSTLGESFHGQLFVRIEYIDGSSKETPKNVYWTLLETLEPKFDSFTPIDGGGIVYLGSNTRAVGHGFLLDGEGETKLHFVGTFTPDSSNVASELDKYVTLEDAQRTELSGPFPADCFGIEPGRFFGDIIPVNEHQDGPVIEGQGFSIVGIDLGPTLLIGIEPLQARRGQKITISGRGFTSGMALTALRVEGTFTSEKGDVSQLAGTDLEVFPKVNSGDQMTYVLTVIPDGKGGVEGFGAEAGTVEGIVTPIIYYDDLVFEGEPLDDFVFRVLPQLQIVYISYLPGFTDALRDFGLRNFEKNIRDRILEVATRDYDGINVEFRTTRPTDYVEYSVIEVGGKDPNDRGLLGLDATMGKDIGNLIFNDIIGGLNAESRENGNYAFGGVFVSSFIAFSPSSEEACDLASGIFDQVFSPFMPAYGGSPAETWEFDYAGDRKPLIENAIHVLGSMIGNTVSHEVGHTLGLAHVPYNGQNIFHNRVPGDDQIMDSGGQRPFEERAEINGSGPAVWTQENRQYLERILPVE
jgi:hypothetical protein